jgi:hypothetical protein
MSRLSLDQLIERRMFDPTITDHLRKLRTERITGEGDYFDTLRELQDTFKFRTTADGAPTDAAELFALLVTNETPEARTLATTGTPMGGGDPS